MVLMPCYEIIRYFTVNVKFLIGKTSLTKLIQKQHALKNNNVKTQVDRDAVRAAKTAIGVNPIDERTVSHETMRGVRDPAWPYLPKNVQGPEGGGYV